MKTRLDENWLLKQAPISLEPSEYWKLDVAAEAEYPVSLPSDVLQPLIAAGRIKEPTVGMNSLDCRWTEEKSWWFCRSFEVSGDELASDQIELVFESLDGPADILLNGIVIGHHRSSHYPFVRDVKEFLKQGPNTLLVRLTSGAESLAQDEVEPYEGSVQKTDERGDARRVFLRKPQYVFGWDWSPRLVTCGIVKDVYLEFHEKVICRNVKIHTAGLNSDSRGMPLKARLQITVEIDYLEDFSTGDGFICFSLEDETGTKVDHNCEFLLKAGINYHDFELEIENPLLWWPNGMGDQHLYRVNCRVEVDGYADSLEAFKYGIRTLRLSTEKRDKRRDFRFVINDVEVFARGAAWIPADAVYCRVSDEKYERLVSEACTANFTMLRVWGGGIYERDVFYRLCDEKGILVWQDFMFACGAYPDDREWFRREVEHEVEHQTRRLRNHACLALWCGSNENHWALSEWWGDAYHPPYPGGLFLYNHLIPHLIRKNCPGIPYWNGTPFGGMTPNANEVGSRHHWQDCMMNPEMDKRITPEEYDKVASAFIAEYGYIGPCLKSSIARYLGTDEIDRKSRAWEWHTNTFEKDTVEAGIRKHYGDKALISPDGYILFGGLVQALMLGYSLEAIRSKPHTGGALFWMFNDCWGETGWTIIDYYLERKPAFYAVKRALASRRLILRREAGSVVLTAINDSPGNVEMECLYGRICLAGNAGNLKRLMLRIPRFGRASVVLDDPDVGSQHDSLFVVRPVQSSHGYLPAILRECEFRKLSCSRPNLKLDFLEVPECPGKVDALIQSDSYAHGVHFIADGELHESMKPDDGYFELLPGEARRIRINGLGIDDAHTVRIAFVMPDGGIEQVC